MDYRTRRSCRSGANSVSMDRMPSLRTLRFDFETVMVAFFTIEFGARIICHSDSFKQLKRFLLCKYFLDRKVRWTKILDYLLQEDHLTHC